MSKYARQLGHVRVWRDGDGWRYVLDGEPAPEHAELAALFDDEGALVIYINRGAAGSSCGAR